MIKKIFTTFILLIIFSVNSFSDNHAGGLKPSSLTGEFYFFSVTDPVKFVVALDKFDSSVCAEKWRKESGVNVGLYSLAGSKHSHMILVTYDGYDNNEKDSIKIKFTGLRPGEKMHEELYSKKESILKVDEDIFLIDDKGLNIKDFLIIHDNLNNILNDFSDQKTIKFFEENIDGFSNNSIGK